MPNSPLLYGPNTTGVMLQNGMLNADGSRNKNDGAKNYLAGNFETNTVQSFTPTTVTATSGLPSGAPSGAATNVSIATTTTNPLSGTYSLQATVTAATLGFQGFISPSFTIDREDQGKVLTIKTYYEFVSGASNFNLSGILSQQNVFLYIYDVTNAVWIQPAGYGGINQSSGPGYATATFQTNAAGSGAVYQLAFLISATVSSTAVINFDDFYVGPQTAPLGAVITDWQAYTPNAVGFGTVTALNAQYRRVGSSIEVRGQFTAGTPTAVTAAVSIPSALVISSAIGANYLAGQAIRGNTAPGNTFAVLASPSATGVNFGVEAQSSSPMATLTGSGLVSAGDVFSFEFSVQIQGYSGTVQMSSDTDTRVVAFRGTAVNNSTISTSPSLIPFNTTYDTAGAFTTATYTVPVSGYYSVNAKLLPNGVSLTTAQGITAYIYQNGAQVTLNQVYGNGATVTYPVQVTDLLKCSAGDTIQIYAASSVATSTNPTAGYTCLDINRLSGPAVIAATESVNARYYSSSTTISGTLATVVFATKSWDTHSAYNNTTGIYTIPVTGKYQVNCSVSSSATLVLNNTLDIQMQQTGSASQISEQTVYAGGAQTALDGNIGDIFYCLAGDTIKVQISNSGTSPAIVASTSKNWFSIARLGN